MLEKTMNYLKENIASEKKQKKMYQNSPILNTALVGLDQYPFVVMFVQKLEMDSCVGFNQPG